MHHTTNVAIIGNSILALTTAYYLTKQDKNLKISIIGDQTRSGAASTAAGVMLNCFAEVTASTTKSEPGRQKLEIAYKALNAWPHFLEELSDAHPTGNKIEHTKGTFIFRNGESGVMDYENFRAITAALDAYNAPYEKVDPLNIPGLNPYQNTTPSEAIFLKNEGCISPHLVIGTLTQILASNPNVEFINKPALSIKSNGDSIEGVIFEDGEEIAAEKVLLACGAFAQKFIDALPQIKHKIPMVLAGVGFSVLMEQDKERPINHVLRTPNRSFACGLHALPQDGLLYAGATNNLNIKPEFHHRAWMTHFLLQCVIEQINQNLNHSAIFNFQAGNRPATLDTFPLIGGTSVDGLYILTGTYRDGFHQSPILGKHMANIILGRESTDIPDTFKPERKLLKLLTVEQSVSETSHHFMAGFYEHSMKLPNGRLEWRVEDMLQHRLHKIYQKIDTKYGLPPDVMLMLEYSEDQDKTIEMIKPYLPE